PGRFNDAGPPSCPLRRYPASHPGWPGSLPARQDCARASGNGQMMASPRADFAMTFGLFFATIAAAMIYV
ncbi:hypothetical protein, partial [Acinetobacter baumannii]|uniref:hypothetical protein n=1 Tax=Acinetobacter baumannii TaxID=470 RepID=UPI001C085A98